MSQKCTGTSTPKVKADKSVAQLKDTVSNYALKAADSITKATPVQQLLAGTASGWVTGSISMKVGKVGALAAGGGVLLFQIAQQQKLTTMNWEKLKEQAERSAKGVDTKYCTRMMQNVSKFGRSNRCFAAGFIGGFLIGLAT